MKPMFSFDYESEEYRKAVAIVRKKLSQGLRDALNIQASLKHAGINMDIKEVFSIIDSNDRKPK